MNLNAKISYFRNYFDPEPLGEITVLQFCDYVINSGQYVKEIKAIRNLDNTDKQRKKLKAQLPAVTISGTFKKREVAGLIRHSGFVCMDIDSKHNPGITDWPALRDDLMNCVNIFFSSLSASGQGVFVIVPILYPDKHYRQVQSLINDFSKVLKINADPACKDICRLRGISHDPGAKINLDAVRYTKVHLEPPPAREVNYRNNDLTLLLELIVDSRIDITGDYQDWFSIGCALTDEFGEVGREHFHAISQLYQKYTRREADTQYNNCLKSRQTGYTKNTIFFIADQYGINLKRMRKR